MNKGKFVFSQVLACVNRYEFQKCVNRYKGDYRSRELNCWNQFAQLFFGQLTARNGLRDICLCLNAHKSQLYHLGIKQSVNQSTLSRANENRDWRIYADFGAYLINLVKPLYTDNHESLSGIDKDVFVLDSTTISVSIILMNWAHGKYSRGAVKMHTLLDLRGSIPTFIHITDGKYHDVNVMDEIEVVSGAVYVMDKAYTDFQRLYKLNQSNAFFVVRAKSNLKFKAVVSRKVDKSTGLRCDQSIKLLVAKSYKFYPEKIRRIKYYDKDKDIILIFLTNEFEMDAIDIATLYKSRWQIEIFFKWIKQNLQVKTLWGHSQNAVKTQLWIAISTYLIVAYLKHQMKSQYTIYEMTQILGISAFSKTPINELFTNEIIKE
ncbi:IS4 family transposase, partial [Flavobacterium sp. RHBU_3]|uniref:IS4 family transposase n=1 Tax=Flavobacterium sp. RHBU_3 TaxID=3391184 RepID=UPI003984F427